MRRAWVMRDQDSEPVVDNEGQEQVEAMVAMALAWGVSAEVAFGDGEA